MNYQIAKPCNQNWNEMETSANGRFCMHCQKEVYDLTAGKPLPNTTGNFCGRIKVDAPAKEISFKKLIWKQNPIKYILLTSLLLFTRNIKAQITDEGIDETYSPIKNQEDSITKTITISGVLTDAKTKETISFANIVVYDSLNIQLGVVTTDINGIYNITLDKAVIKGKNISVKAIYIGYEPVIIKDIPINTLKQKIIINMKGGNALPQTGEVIIVEPNEPAKQTKDDFFKSEYDTKKITPDMECEKIEKKPR